MTEAGSEKKSGIAVLFDLDGTLLDTAEDFVLALGKQCTRHSVSAPAPHIIRATVSEGSRALVKLAFQLDDADESDIQRYREEFLQDYHELLGKSTRTFDGIDALLSFLGAAHIPWGIVTNKPRLYAEELLQSMALQPPMQVLVCPDDVAQAKPHPEPLLLAAGTLNIKPQDCLYFGDHERDIEAGRRAGMTTVATAYGYIPANSDIYSWQADHIVQHAEELLAIVKNFMAERA